MTVCRTVKAVDLRYLSALVIASEQSDPVWPAGLQSQQSGQSLQTEVAAVDEVTQEHVVRLGHATARPEQLLEVIELAVNVTADRDRSGHRLNITLLDQNGGHEIAQHLKSRSETPLPTTAMNT